MTGIRSDARGQLRAAHNPLIVQRREVKEFVQPFSRPVTEIIRERYSCRAYRKAPIAAEQAAQLAAFAESVKTGPLGAPLRFELAAATEQDARALRGLGTYGLIRNPAGFLIGAAGRGDRNLEDFGYGLEAIILHAAGIGVATCWLGGNFTRSSFARKIRAAGDEMVPAVASAGYPARNVRARDPLRRMARSDTRLPWGALFFRSGFEHTLSTESAGAYAVPLEMLRLAPSASNRQPWRVVQDGPCYHFFLRRSLGYGPSNPAFALLGMADLQRVDIGIAMCHFELTARELGLAGAWDERELDVPTPGDRVEYAVTWVGSPPA